MRAARYESARLEQELGGLIGAGQHCTALCPVHRGAEPSMSVDLTTGAWRCAVCDVSGTGADELRAAVLEASRHGN